MHYSAKKHFIPAFTVEEKRKLRRNVDFGLKEGKWS
jgi:hypothetical protein